MYGKIPDKNMCLMEVKLHTLLYSYNIFRKINIPVNTAY